MIRRGFLKSALLSAGAFLGVCRPTATSPALRPVHLDENGQAHIDGVVVVRFPSQALSSQVARAHRDVAVQIATKLRQGGGVALPDTRNADGSYAWDIRIEGGPVGQVASKYVAVEGFAAAHRGRLVGAKVG